MKESEEKIKQAEVKLDKELQYTGTNYLECNVNFLSYYYIHFLVKYFDFNFNWNITL